MNAVTCLVPEGILKENKHIFTCIYTYRDDRVKATCFVWKNHVPGCNGPYLLGYFMSLPDSAPKDTERSCTDKLDPFSR